MILLLPPSPELPPMIRIVHSLVPALCLIATPALPQAFAYVQAPEVSGGIAVAADIGTAIDRAMADCVAGGGDGQSCRLSAACDPIGWAIDLFVQHREGPHWHEVHCGLPDRPSAEAVAAALCDPDRRPWLIECATVGLWARDGTRLIPD
jgi:hypothetical protein